MKKDKKKIEFIKNYFEEQIQDDGIGTKEERISKIIKQSAWVCAVVAVFPLPIADIYVLSSIQFVMALRIGEVYGKKVDRSEFLHILKSLGLSAVLGYFAQATAIGLYRTVLPGFGAITTVPLVYSLTFAIGKILQKYFELEEKGGDIKDIDFKEVWKELKQEGEQLAKKISIDELKREAKKIYGNLLGKVK